MERLGFDCKPSRSCIGAPHLDNRSAVNDDSLAQMIQNADVDRSPTFRWAMSHQSISLLIISSLFDHMQHRIRSDP